MAAQYARDNEVRFRQVELTGITVDALFVDVPVSSYANSATEKFLKRINPMPPGSDRRRPMASKGEVRPGRATSSTQAGAAQAILHPEWSGGAVIVGGPGQGKTTLLQFLCQFYRARALERNEYSPIAADLSPVSNVCRIPIRIELTDYAEWRREELARAKQPAGTKYRRRARSRRSINVTLESYVARQVSVAAGQNFTTNDLVLALTSEPMLLAFDSLDEVADSDERDEVADEIRATNSRLAATGKDVQILVATRPGSVGRPIWRDPNLNTLFLGQLTPPLRMKYLERWTAQSKLTPVEIKELRATFTESIMLPHVSELAGNPMQLAILLHLMQRRTVLPEKRTALYDRYIDVFMDREAKYAIVAEYKDLIVAFHKLLAWHIHTQVEQGVSKGTIGLTRLRELLTEYLIPRGGDVEFIDELFKSVTTRVLCLVQRDLDSHEFQFEVQPLREYFTAEHIYDSSPNNSSKNNRPACFSALLRRPYWANVMRFFAGKLAPGEVPALIYVLKESQDDKQLGGHPISRAAAKFLLDDQVLSGQLEAALMDMVKVILDGPGPVLAVDGLLQLDDALLRFQERAGAKQATEILVSRAATCDDDTTLSAVADLLQSWGLLKLATDQWWQAADRTESFRWLRTMAILRGLCGLDAQYDYKISQVVSRLDQNSSIAALLEGVAIESCNDALVTRLLDEIRSGRADLDSLKECHAYLWQIARSSSVARFHRHLGQGGQAASPNADVGKSPELKLVGVCKQHVESLDTCHGRPCDWDDSASWHRLFDSVEKVWEGDCWPVREALFSLPDSANSRVASMAEIGAGVSWRHLARWKELATRNRSSVEWWSEQFDCCIDEPATMFFVMSAVSLPSGSVVRHISDALNQRVAGLNGAAWATICAALRRLSIYRPELTGPSFSEALRLRQVELNGRLAVALWYLSRDSARVQLRPYIEADLERLWNSGDAVGEVVREVVSAAGRPLRFEIFEQARRDFPAGSLAAVKVRKPTVAQAQKVLRNPSAWPTDLVRMAADHLGSRLSSLSPLSRIAEEDGWNV